MKKIVFIIMSVFMTLSLYGEHYYSGGEKHDLIKIKSRNLQINPFLTPKSKIDFYENSTGNTIGVIDEIIVGYSDVSIKRSIENEYNLIQIKDLKNNMYLYKVMDKNISLEISNKLYNLKGVEFSHPNFLKKRKKRTADPLYSNSWHLENRGDNPSIGLERGADINATGAWSITKGEGIKVGITDDAVDINHEDLRDNIAGYRNYADSFTDDPSPLSQPGNEDGDWHGTACSGLIAASENNKGSVGVAPKSTLYAVKLGNSAASAIEAFNWLNSQGVDIVSNSWGTNQLDDGLNNTFRILSRNGRDGKGMIILFATGNDGVSLDDPGMNDESESPYVLGIGASAENDFLTSYSNYGSSVDFVAPGSEYGTIVTTDVTGAQGYNSNGNYAHDFSGTSAATPIAAGVVSLVLSANPNLTRDQLIETLKETSDKIGYTEYINGRNIYYGYGRLNAGKAVVKVKPLIEDKGLDGFIERLYSEVFGRSSDTQGMNFWKTEFENGRTAANVAQYFFTSNEFTDENYNNIIFVNKAYMTLLDREADAEGRNYWLNELEQNGKSRKLIVNGFSFSNEFANLCQEYNVTNYDSNDQLEAFIERMYRLVLNRDSDPQGMEEWTAFLKSGEKSASEIVKGFFSSDEYINKNLNNTEFIKVAYRSILGREADQAGLTHWINEMQNNGLSTTDIIEQFLGSDEFSNLALEYGMVVYKA